MRALPTPGKTFTAKKQKILSQLSVPDGEYTDASPKGTVDADIRRLIDQINAHAGLVTTSSCAGRVSVYLEGKKAVTAATVGRGDDAGEEEAVPNRNAASSAGGKGGGEWLFVSHEPVGVAHVDGEGRGYEVLLGLQAKAAEEGETTRHVGELTGSSRLIHFKFEPMVRSKDPVPFQGHGAKADTDFQILHVLTASLEHAQLVIQAGMEAGFRETGAVSLLGRPPDEEAMPMVAVRSMGLSFGSLVGAETDNVNRLIVSPQYLSTLVKIANERFVENERRIARFSTALDAIFAPHKGEDDWEDAQARRERKRQEGLRRREQLKKDKSKPADEPSIDFLLQEPDVI
jgi:tRNA wybutosine-synthesizing protein 3